MSYDTVRHWKNKFESNVESIKNAPKSGRPKYAAPKEIVSKIKEIIEGDARYTICDIARKVGISLSTVQLILKKHLKVRKVFARWVPHLLTDEQNRQRVKVTKKLFQMSKTGDKKQFAKVVTGDENRVYYFEHVRKVSNKNWATIVDGQWAWTSRWTGVYNRSLIKVTASMLIGLSKIVSEYDQEIPQSKTADNTMVPRGRTAQPSRDTRKTN